MFFWMYEEKRLHSKSLSGSSENISEGKLIFAGLSRFDNIIFSYLKAIDSVCFFTLFIK